MATIVKAPEPKPAKVKTTNSLELGRMAASLKAGQAVKLDGSSRGAASVVSAALTGYSGQEYRCYQGKDGAYYLRNSK